MCNPGKHYNQILDGKDWILEEGDVLYVTSPASGMLLGKIRLNTNNFCNTIASAALKGLENFGKTSVAKRLSLLENLFCLLDANQEQLSHVISLETGKPIKCSTREVLESISLIKKYHFEDNFKQLETGSAMLALTGYNLPLFWPVKAIVSAIVSGSSLVICPSQKSPVTANHAVRLALQAGYSALSLIHSSHEEFLKPANSLCFKTINLIGLQPDSKKSLANAKVPLTINLLDPLLHTAMIIEDVPESFDMEGLAKKLARFCFEFAGQQPFATRWIMVNSNLYYEFLSVFEKAMNLVMYGDVLDHTVDIGPMISIKETDEACNHIEEMINSYAFRLFGDTEPNRMLYQGWLKPTVLCGELPHRMPVKSDIFAPLVCIIPCNSSFEALHSLEDMNFTGLISMFVNPDTIKDKLKELKDNIKIVFNDFPIQYSKDL